MWSSERCAVTGASSVDVTNCGAAMRAKTSAKMIERETGIVLTVDAAFDFCLTKIKGQFLRRDSFVATSDFCRSLLVVGILLIPAVVRVLMDVHGTCLRMATYGGGIVLALALFLYLAGRRMMRFRDLSDRPVFRVYLACAASASPLSGMATAEAADTVAE